MAAKPRNMTALANPVAAAACTPREAPRITMAVLMYHSGRVASFRKAVTPGKKFPRIRPARRATMKPASPVRPRDQGILKAACLSGVTAM